MTLRTQANESSLRMQVTKVRASSPAGVIVHGHSVIADGNRTDKSIPIVMVAPRPLVDLVPIEIGGIYEISGVISIFEHRHGDYVVREHQITASSLILVRPSGSQLIGWLAANVAGIGEVKAVRLWDNLGLALYDILETKDHDSLITLVPAESVRTAAFEAWHKSGDTKALRFFQEKGIPLDLAAKVIRVHSADAVEALTEDPYRLVSFESNWKRIDRIAQAAFGVSINDSRRQVAALEEVLYRLTENGHTCADQATILPLLNSLLSPALISTQACVDICSTAVACGNAVRIERRGVGFYSAPGLFLLEKSCAATILSMLKDSSNQGSDIQLENELNYFELDERRRLADGRYQLTPAQREAVVMAINHRFSLITGGAGVGKTTVLRVLVTRFESRGNIVYQLALSGRAASRMAQSSGRPAMTIAAYLLRICDLAVDQNIVLIIDEASMVDVLSFYQITRSLPPNATIVLMGDPHQLPPIGAGLILHVLTELPSIPQTELTTVKRQSERSTIPGVAASIRAGQWPTFSDESSDEAAFLECEDHEILPVIVDLFLQNAGDTQILCATKHCPFAGTHAINRVLHARCGNSESRIAAPADLDGLELCVGDRVMYTRNDWPRNLQNGSLGVVTSASDWKPGASQGAGLDRQALGSVAFENGCIELFAPDLEVLDYAYAITIHKAQGSQFPRVLVALRRSRVLDRTLVYTAMTRAQNQIIFVGNAAAARDAVRAAPKAFMRNVNLRELLASRG